jgi:hypothetical protein
MNTSNIKDTLTTVCGVIFFVCTSIVTMNVSGVILPTWLTSTCGVLIGISGAIIGWLTGKTPAGVTKTDTQVAQQNKG